MKYNQVVNNRGGNSQVFSAINSSQVRSNAGGYVYQITPLQQLDRFLIMGTLNNTYYANARDLTAENIRNFDKLLASDPGAYIEHVVNISVSGRSPNNDHALLAMAYATSKEDARDLVVENINKVARTGSQFLTFVAYALLFRNWGRSLRRAIDSWYLNQTIEDVAYQITKYPNRNPTGAEMLSHKNIIRNARVHVDCAERDAAYRWVLGKEYRSDLVPEIMHVVDAVKACKTEKEVTALINQYGLTKEFVPRQWHGSKSVWEALMPNLPPRSFIAEFGRLTNYGLLNSFDAINLVREKLSAEQIKRARIHPVNMLQYMTAYGMGHGKSQYAKITWTPNQRVLTLMEEGFYHGFGCLKPTNKNIMIALDISGSMTAWPIRMLDITAREASAAMAMALVRTEPNVIITVFSSGIREADINRHDRLSDVVYKTGRYPFSSTAISLPMIYAKDNNLDVDAIVIYTDNELNDGPMHPSQALNQLRSHLGHDVSMIVNAMTATSFSVADPDDVRSMDMVGFDANAPQITQEFIVGW